MRKTELIIFDCDGVLVDSEDLSSQVIAEEISHLGLSMSGEEAKDRFKGGSLSDVKKYIENHVKLPPAYDFEAVFREKSFALFKKSLQPVSGIQEVLKTIQLQKCVASNGPLNKMLLNLKLTNLFHHFEGRLFSAYEVNRWKPDPFLFLHAAKTMGVEPAKCLVVEDSSSGVHAAVAAGMPVLAYAAHDTGDDLSRAGATVFQEMRDLPDLIF